MTIDAFQARQEPLLTKSDMIERITVLLAPGINPSQLWVLLLDGLRRQLPIMLPIEGCPELPEPALLDALTGVLVSSIQDSAGVDAARDNPALGGATADEAGAGGRSVIFVRERRGADAVTALDRCWAAGLTGASERAGVSVTGIFLLGPHRVLPIDLD